MIPTSKDIISKVEEVFEVDIETIQSNSRIREVTDARKAITYFLRKYLNMGSNSISYELNKGHYMVIYYYREAESLISNERYFKNNINIIKEHLQL